MIKFSFFGSLLAIVLILTVVEARGRRDVDPNAEEMSSTTTTTEPPKVLCEGKGKVCVEPKLCVKGLIDGNTLSRNYNYTKLCNATDVCCELKSFDPKDADKCAVRNLNTQPQGPLPINANFAEFPWQTMILRESTKSLLCGGIIIKKNFVLTRGQCVAGQKTYDLLAKGGEWELGKESEGIDFDLNRLKSISYHPDLNLTELSHDLAILHMERDFKFNIHIQQLCYENDYTPPKPGDYCIVTGWGRDALATHRTGAIEHYTIVEIEDSENCTKAVGIRKFNPDVSICGRTTTDACEFDFGSALACQTKPNSQEFVLKGIYSHNTGCLSRKPVLVFAKNDPEWINSVISPEKVKRN